MLKKILRPVLCLLFLASPALAYGDDAPAWLRQAAGLTLPTYDKKVSAVTLIDESTNTVSEDGKLVQVTTGAVRILNKEGRRAAVAHAIYSTDTGKVREIKAWLIRPSGQVKAYGGKDVVGEAAGP